MAGLAVGGWAYGTGRLGFGPLSAQDKAAARAIAAGVKGPSWADDDQRSCAATELLHHHRSGALRRSGLITPAGSGDWTFTGSWDTADAHTYADALLGCSDDWRHQLGQQWHLSDTACLDQVGRSEVADVLVTTALGVHDDAATKAHDAAADALDHCYGTGVANPTGTAKPAYRAVDFHFDLPSAANAETSLTVRGPDGTEHVDGKHYRASTDAGGQHLCVKVTLRATYGWGSTTTSSTRVCGTSKPKQVRWQRLAHCGEFAGCVVWALHVDGFRPGFAHLRITDDTGGCPLTSGNCSRSALIGSDGRGFDHGYVLRVTGGSGRRNDLIATMGGITARVPG